MQYSQANEIASRWFEAAEELGVSTSSYTFMRKSLGALLSDDAKAGIAVQADAPVVLAFDGDRLICVAVDQADEDNESTVRAASLSVASSPRLDVELTVSSATLVKTWTFWEANAKAFTVTTQPPVNDGSEVDFGGDAVMTAVAASLGWPIPS
jgi:hypothetical protein